MKTKIALVVVFLASVVPAALGQGWEMPAKTPDTEVVCDAPGCEDPRYSGKKLFPYSAPITGFVGRFVDSSRTRSYQFTFRTARARIMKIAPERGRIYLMLGSAIAAYDINTFFTRLANNEPLFQSSSVAVDPPNVCGVGRSGNCAIPEVFLKWDRYFYAENGPSNSCNHKLTDPPGTRRCPWLTRAGDGDIRLFSFDYDDRGYVYPATGAFGWGIVHDDTSSGSPELMRTKYQHFPPIKDIDDPDPNRMIVVKVPSTSGGAASYYAITGGDYRTTVFNVNNPEAPTRFATRETSGFLSTYAKTADGSFYAVLTSGNQLQIYTPGELARLGAPLFSPPGIFHSVATDGTNFYASSVQNGKLVISLITTSGGIFPHVTTMGAKDGANITYGAGYIVASGYDTTWFSSDVRLFKVTNGSPVEVPLNGYVAKHYANPPNGFTSPEFQQTHPAHVYRSGGSYYLIINNFGLGDVYTIKGADSIAPKIKASGKTKNDFSVGPTLPANSAYYGDEITFTSESSSSPPPSVNWTFGDGTSFLAPSGTPDVPHQYGGLLATDLPKTFNVVAKNAADASVVETLTVKLEKPEARVSVMDGATTLFPLVAGDNTALPIVSSDEFVDASFGAVEGHYSDWRLVNEVPSTKQLPTQKFSVGPVGLHTVNLIAHYGPYTGSGPSLVSTSTDAQFVFSANYRVRPFAVLINPPTQQGANVEFTALGRATRIADDLVGGDQLFVNFTWDLVKPNGTGGWVSTGHTKIGTATLADVISPSNKFTVPRTAFQGADGWKVTLLTTLVTPTAVKDPLNASVTAEHGPLNGPTPSAIEKTGCDTIGAPCSFSTPSSRPDIDPNSWNYVWAIPGTSLTSTGKVFQPKFTTAGSYTVNVKVSNALGDANLTFGPFEVGGALCASAPTANTTTISIVGETSGCFADATCAVNESIRFTTTPSGWSFGNCDVYTWNFGDGTAPVVGEKIMHHTYAAAGQYTVTLQIDGGLSDATVTRTVNVGTGGGGPGPGPGVCPTIVPGTNVYVSFIGTGTLCTSTSANNCQTTEDISFRALSQAGYVFSCGAHTFSWNFGDGGTGNAQNVLHRYSADGTYNGTLTVNNGIQSVTLPFTVKVGNGSGTGPGPCKEMTANGNVGIGFSGTQSNCNASSGPCRPGESIGFLALASDYSYSCASHSFQWNFGDGSTSNQQNPSKVYNTGGTYKVTLTISNPTQSLTLERNVTVSANSCSPMVPEGNVFVSYLGPTSNCTASGGECAPDEELTFTAKSFGYNYNCANHNFVWEFGDGSTANGQTVNHKYTRGGTFHYKLTISNSGQEVVLTGDVVVAGGKTKRRGVRH